MSESSILEASGVVRRFGGVTAVDVDHIEIPRGRITALIGPNGAGKTTFFNLLTGFDKPSSGTWTFEGRNVEKLPAYRVARLGMVRTFQLTKALEGQTVRDNMLLGGQQQAGENFWVGLVPPLWRARERQVLEEAEALLDRFNLLPKIDDYAGSLSGGQRKLLEMARALLAHPRLIMLDEPMAGVNPALVQSLLGHILQLKEDGVTVLFIEHDMHMVRTVADWVIVMAEGRIVAQGDTAEVMDDPAVVSAYLGAHSDTNLREIIRQRRAEKAAATKDVS